MDNLFGNQDGQLGSQREQLATVDPVDSGMDFETAEKIAQQARKDLDEAGNPFTFLVKSVKEYDSEYGGSFRLELSVTGSGDPGQVGRTTSIFIDKNPRKDMPYFERSILRLVDFVNLLKEETGVNIWTGRHVDPASVIGKTFRADISYWIPDDPTKRPRLQIRRVRV